MKKKHNVLNIKYCTESDWNSKEFCVFVNLFPALSTDWNHGIQEVSGSIPLISTRYIKGKSSES